MELKWAGAAALLLTTLPPADAQAMGLTDPTLCYILDGLLFLYALIITSLFFREKFSKPKDSPATPEEIDDTYNKLSLGQRDEYDVLNKNGSDAESGGRKQQRRTKPQDGVYSALQRDKMSEAYSEVAIKEQQRRRGKGTEGLYQGLSAATKDTYDALQMQPLPPR
ncbi:T-cell surface glycoprotein CD3 zeta chain isoform X2 [Ambystoma mexicanum]|uniref:T-cell surface glycoprotein CD3 zeta chain isoform X2 n=1 Tax=Ambystoma mexicanum TaxID=8296 RepID=UPI0037E7B99F